MDLGDKIFGAYPNAARIAFTGTPLLSERHGEKKSYKRFGEYIDTYWLMDAVEEDTVVESKRMWIDRLAKQLVHEVVVDQAFVNRAFARDGGPRGWTSAWVERWNR